MQEVAVASDTRVDSGEDLGIHRFAVPGWKVGDLIPLGGVRSLAST